MLDVSAFLASVYHTNFGRRMSRVWVPGGTQKIVMWLVFIDLTQLIIGFDMWSNSQCCDIRMNKLGSSFTCTTNKFCHYSTLVGKYLGKTRYHCKTAFPLKQSVVERSSNLRFQLKKGWAKKKKQILKFTENILICLILNSYIIHVLFKLHFIHLIIKISSLLIFCVSGIRTQSSSESTAKEFRALTTCTHERKIKIFQRELIGTYCTKSGNDFNQIIPSGPAKT